MFVCREGVFGFFFVSGKFLCTTIVVVFVLEIVPVVPHVSCHDSRCVLSSTLCRVFHTFCVTIVVAFSFCSFGRRSPGCNGGGSSREREGACVEITDIVATL